MLALVLGSWSGLGLDFRVKDIGPVNYAGMFGSLFANVYYVLL